jgi:hypothetical protein
VSEIQRLSLSGPKVCILNFFAYYMKIFSFLSCSLAKVFPVVYFHPFESVYPDLKDSCEGFLSDFIENMGDCARQALPVLDLIFGTFVLQMAKEEGAACRWVSTVNRV